MGCVGRNVRCNTRSTSNQRDMIMLVRLPRILRNRPLEIQPLIRLHAVHVLAHDPILIPLDHEINVALGVLVANRRIRPDDRLLHLGPLVPRQQRRCDRQARDGIAVGQREAEFLRVVVQLLDGLEFQADEALIPAQEGLLWRGGRRGGGEGYGLAFVGRWRSVGFGFGRFGDAVVVVSSS